MKKFCFGLIIGILCFLGTTATASSVKQYILTDAPYPIVVNDVEFKDTTNPILNYNGSTYIPLAKLANLTGIAYKWNEELFRVEISVDPATFKIPEEPAAPVEEETAAAPEETASSSALQVVDGEGDYAGYKRLTGYSDEDKYAIYFKGDQNSYRTTIEDLRGIDLNERVSWTYDGVSYSHTRRQLYGLFLDTTWFQSNLGMSNDLLSVSWFEQTFGSVYDDWFEGMSYSNEAARWVQRYFDQSAPKTRSNITLTPDAVVE